MSKTRTRADKIEGIIVAPPTPFHENDIDVNALRELIGHLIESGVHGLMCLGVTAEFPSLTEKECKRIMDIMAPGRGFTMGTACLDWRTPKENVHAFIKAAKKYGIY